MIDVREFDCVYNLGALMFGCRVIQTLVSVSPPFLWINHFQALLGPYAATEGRSHADQETHAAGQKFVAAGASLNIFISRNELVDAIESGMSLSEQAIQIIPNGLSFDHYDRIKADRSHLGSNAGSRFVIFTGGRFSDSVKGADLLYRAFARLAEQHPHVYLLAITNSDRFSYLLGHLPPDRWRIERWLPRHRFLEMLAGADLAVLPSRYEPFGLIAIEALSLGVPVVANAVGGLADIVRHEEFGLLNPLSEGSFGLYSAMRSLVANPSRLKQMGTAGRNFVRQEYAITRVAGQVEDALERVCRLTAHAS
jgi:glycosyltransferase involved in cell wall biosynthesis